MLGREMLFYKCGEGENSIWEIYSPDGNFVLLTSYYRNKKLAEDATATMIRGTAVRPEERRRKILESLQLVFLITSNMREIVWALSI